jgi:hypothetical protein
LRSRPSRTSLAHPVALDLREHELELFVDGQQPPEQVRASFDAQIDATRAGAGLPRD